MNSENRSENNIEQGAHSPRALKRPSLRVAVTWIIPAVIVILALVFAKYQIATRPKAQRQKPPQQARLVTVESAQMTNHTTVVSAMGTVAPAKQITLSPEVSGRVVFIGPFVIPGGTIEKGQSLIRIDDRDYRAIVKQRQSDVAKAELNLKLEQGNQLVAQQEYKLLDDIIQDQDEELVLRKPHLEEALAALEAAKAALAKAKLDVERCTVTAPFNAVIQEKLVDVGAQVTTASSLLKIMGTDEYWVEVLVPVNQLRWLTIPENGKQSGSAVKVYNSLAWGANTYRDGTALRLLGQLEEQGRMAQLLVCVKDPLLLKNESSALSPLLVDSYVRVEIEGKKLEGVMPVKRDYLHDGDNIWVMNSDDQMEIRPVEVLFRDKQMIYLTNGLKVGDQIVTTDISAPVEGMPLRLNDTSADVANPEAQP